MAEKTKTGLVLGKFMPLHQGHLALFDFAHSLVDRLFIVVDEPANATIDLALRQQWVRYHAREATVFSVTEPTPQYPEEHPQFWNYWRDLMLRLLPEKPDLLIASEAYGETLANVVGAAFIPFDPGRHLQPISATQIRENPMTYWDYLSDAAKGYYVKRISIFGPESTGKSTLSQQLAEQFNTIMAPEYARIFHEMKGGIKREDMLSIAKAQSAIEDMLAMRANRLLICDTDPLATTIWHQWLFKKPSEPIQILAQQRSYDLTLLCKPDLPWQEDSVRYFPDGGEAFFDDCQRILEEQNRCYTVIEGKGDERLQRAINAISSTFPDIA